MYQQKPEARCCSSKCCRNSRVQNTSRPQEIGLPMLSPASNPPLPFSSLTSSDLLPNISPPVFISVCLCFCTTKLSPWGCSGFLGFNWERWEIVCSWIGLRMANMIEIRGFKWETRKIERKKRNICIYDEMKMRVRNENSIQQLENKRD